MSLWITSKGVDRLTHIIDAWITGEESRRQQDVLGVIERRGGGYTAEQVIDILEKRPIDTPLVGSRSDYYRTIERLERNGCIDDL